MPTRSPTTRRRRERALPSWKLEDAKARFSELVRTAESAGPQCVTVRGRPSVVVLSRAEFERLRPAGEAGHWVDRLAALGRRGLAAVAPERARDRGRDLDL